MTLHKQLVAMVKSQNITDVYPSLQQSGHFDQSNYTGTHLQIVPTGMIQLVILNYNEAMRYPGRQDDRMQEVIASGYLT